MCSSYHKCSWCDLKAKQPISDGWQTAWLPSSWLPTPALTPTCTAAKHQHKQFPFIRVLFHVNVLACVCQLRLSSPHQGCSVPPKKEGLALLNPVDKAFLTTVHKGPFIPPIPKIATGCDHEMNTQLWIPLKHCLLTRTSFLTHCPHSPFGNQVLTLSVPLDMGPFISTNITSLEFTRSLEKHHKTPPIHSYALARSIYNPIKTNPSQFSSTRTMAAFLQSVCHPVAAHCQSTTASCRRLKNCTGLFLAVGEEADLQCLGVLLLKWLLVLPPADASSDIQVPSKARSSPGH